MDRDAPRLDGLPVPRAWRADALPPSFEESCSRLLTGSLLKCATPADYGPADRGAGTLSNKQGSGPTYFQHAGGASGMAGDLARGMRSDRLAPLKFAASELADDLSPDERTRLRESGELPEWFLPRVQERAIEIRRDLRRRRY